MQRAIAIAALVAAITGNAAADQAAKPAAADRGARPAAGSPAAREAAALFDEGLSLYARGSYARALQAFKRAQQLAPHPATLFNIARCHQNLGQSAAALAAFGQLLRQTTDPKRRLELEQRVQQLRSRPVKIFVTSEPAGAEVFVDGHDQPAPGRTPTVVQLSPGAHLLLLRRDGFQLTPRRVQVELGKEQPVKVQLTPLPGPVKAQPCPKPRPCPKLSMVDADNLHLHLGLLGAVGWTTDLPTAVGPGAQLLGTYRRLVFGAHFTWLFVGESPISQPVTIESAVYDRTNARWLLFEVEGGWVFPLRSAWIYTTAAAGLAAERVVFVGQIAGNGEEDDFVKEEFGFVWSLGGGIEAMATSWLSFGAALRVGAIHGNRVDRQDPNNRRYDQHHFPFATLWASTSLHL